MGNFVKNKSQGRFGEQLVYNYLQLAGLEPEFNIDKETRHLWDLQIKVGKKTARIEVKLDFLSNKTNNMAIEVLNPISGKLTGLNITKAEIWAVLIRDSDNWIVFLTKTSKLTMSFCKCILTHFVSSFIIN